MQNKENTKPVQEIKFGMTMEEFEQTAKQLLAASGSHVKIAFGINENYELSLSFYSVAESNKNILTEDSGESIETFVASKRPCPPYTGCPKG
jgi:hypothetical protein